MKHNQRIGKWSQETAVESLIQKGCEILEKNGCKSYGEIDILAKQGDTTLFIEVKTRRSNTRGLPEESITSHKRQHLIACAEHYAAENEIDHSQIDAISIVGKPGTKPVITYFENAI